MSERQKAGRKPYPAHKVRTGTLNIAINQEELQIIKGLALRRGMSMANYIRFLIAMDLKGQVNQSGVQSTTF